MIKHFRSFPLLLLLLLVIGQDLLKAQVASPIDEAVLFNGNQDTKGTVSNLTIENNDFTGICNVSLPLYSYYLSGKKNVGVSINYNTQGIKVDQMSSNIGLGWNLFCGGYINRIIRGLPDELNTPGCPSFLFFSGDITQTGYWYGGGNDDEPDYFNANIGGKTFSFMFSKTGDLLLIPDNANVTIDRKLNGTLIPPGSMDASISQQAGDLRFIITDELGNKFYFTHSIIEDYVYHCGSPVGTWDINFHYITSWQLEKIISYDNTEIDYLYDDIALSSRNANAEQFREKNDNYGIATYNSTINYHYNRLRNISYPNGINVIFNYDLSNQRVDQPGDYRLQNISINERNPPIGTAPVQYAYVFDHSYFFSPYCSVAIAPADYISGTLSNERDIVTSISLLTMAQAPTQFRLKLNSIKLTGTDGSSTKNYFTFGYFPVALPERLNGARDLYGFANSHTPQPYSDGMDPTWWLTIPVHSFLSTTYPTVGTDNSVDADERFAEACILTNITNQNGGQTQLSYNLASNNCYSLMNVGGLQLHSIFKYDGFSHQNDITSTYIYCDGEHFMNEDNFTYNIMTHTQWGIGQTHKMYSNIGNILNTTVNGPNYGYKTVTATATDYLGNQVYKRIRNYTGINNIDADGAYIDNNLYTPDFTNTDPNFNQSFTSPPYTNKQFLRPWGIGLLIKEQNFDNLNNISSQTKNYYDVSQAYQSSNFQSHHYLGKDYSVLVDGTGDEDHAYDNGCIGVYTDLYFPFSGHTALRTIDHRDYYSNTNYFENITSYIYDSKNNLTQIQDNNSIGELITRNNYYNYSWGASPCPAITQMNTDGIQRLLYSDKWKNTGGANNLISLNVDVPTIVPGTSLIRPTYFYSLATAPTSPITFSFWADMGTMSTGSPTVSYFQLKGGVTRFDDHGNAIETSDLAGSGGNVYNAKIIDGETGNTLAEAQNAKFGDIAYCGFESDYSWPSPFSLSTYIAGNWNFNPVAITTSHFLLGRCSFHCSSSAGTTLNTTGALQIGHDYYVSFWVLSGGSISVNDGSSSTVTTSPVATYTVPATGEVWTLYKGRFMAAGTTIGMWGEGYIDEIKVYPVNCLMQTHNYLPLIGKTADVDVNDNITSYEYDAFGNLSVTRDQNGNVLSKSKTVNQGY